MRIIQVSEAEIYLRQNLSKAVKSRLHSLKIVILARKKEVWELNEAPEVNPKILKDLFLISRPAKLLHLRQV